ncbi:MAG: cytochrome P450 [Gammaproteobacteria bacterium]|nr:cytochrome P450 [Gammaproteobacteria bacterium]
MFRFDPYSPEVDADPFPFYQTLRDEHPCFWSEEANMWILSRYADIVTALNDWETYSSAQGNLMTELPGRAGSTLGTTDPPRHDRLRSLIQMAVTKRALDHIIEPARASINEHLDAIGDASSFDFVSQVASRYTVDLLFYLFNMPEASKQAVHHNAVLMVQSDPLTHTKGPEHIAAFEWMSDFSGQLIEERKLAPGDDLMSQFIVAEIDGEKLLDREVQMTVTTLIMAGVESMSGFMSMMALNLADHPEQRRILVDDPACISDAVEESLRYNTSAQRFRRVLTRDVQLHGQTMKAGDFVGLAYGSGNRDERQFENPDIYDVTRKPKGHLGFGGGVHACLGTAIARLACKTAFEEFLKRYPDFSRVEQQLPWISSSTFRSPTRLELSIR